MQTLWLKTLYTLKEANLVTLSRKIELMLKIERLIIWLVGIFRTYKRTRAVASECTAEKCAQCICLSFNRSKAVQGVPKKQKKNLRNEKNTNFLTQNFKFSVKTLPELLQRRILCQILWDRTFIEQIVRLNFVYKHILDIQAHARCGFMHMFVLHSVNSPLSFHKE